MSLIVAANLVDRIYMCADTRLSRIKNKDGIRSYEVVHENQLKILPILHSHMAVGCVGSPALGAFLLKRLLEGREAPIHIRQFREEIAFLRLQIKAWTDEYMCQPPASSYDDANCVLLFAGQDLRLKRKINGSKLYDLAAQFQASTQKEFEDKFNNKPLQEFTQEDLSRLRYEMLRKPQMGVKHVVLEALNQIKGPTTDIELNLPDQFIFTLEVRASNAYSKPENFVVLRDFEWGETAVYGAGHDASILPATFFGTLDLSTNSGKLESDIVPFMHCIRDKFAETIGGSITNIVLMSGDVLTLTHRLTRRPHPTSRAELIVHTEFLEGKLHHYRSSKPTRLIPFSETVKGTSQQIM